MNLWCKFIVQAKRALLTVGITSFLTLIAFIIFTPDSIGPSRYYGVWITLPPVADQPPEIRTAQTGQGRVQVERESQAARLAVLERVPDFADTAASSTQTASASEVTSIQSPEPTSGNPREGLAAEPLVTAPSRLQSPSNPATAKSSVDANGPLFAINLESTVQPTDPSAVAMRPEIESRRLYVTHFEKDGQIWYRLRLGFFQSENAARQALEGLRSAYPRAWVTRIPAEEAVASAETAIYGLSPFSENPTLLVAAPPGPSSELADPGRSYLNLTVPDLAASRRGAVDAPERQQNAQEIASQWDSDGPASIPQTAKPSVADSSDSPDGATRGFRFRGSPYKASSQELALLQRWDPTAQNPQQPGNNLALDGQAGSVGYSLGVEGETVVDRPIREQGLNAASDWKQSFAMHGNLSVSSSANLQFSNKLIEQRDADEEYAGTFLIRREPDEWRQNKISSSMLDIGLLDDRLTSKTVLNTSRYTDSASDDKYIVGYQLLQRLDLQVLRGENTRLSIFGAYGEVDQDYNDFALDDDDKTKMKNPFSDPGQAGLKFGGTLGLGPADLTLAQTDSWDAEDSDGSQTTAYEAKLGLDLNRLRDLTGSLLGETFWNIAPDSVYVSYGLGSVDPYSGAATDDRTTDMSAGADWNWGGGYSSISYWSSYYDNRQPGSDEYDWAGDGFDFGGGMWGNRWNFDGWLSLSRSEQMGEWSEARDLSLGGGLSMSYRPDDLPDLKVSAGYDQYRGDYIASDGTSQSQSWVFTSELNFTKYWAELWGPRPSNLGMVFQLRNDSTSEKWGGTADRNSDTEFFIGLKMGIGLGSQSGVSD